MTLKRRDSNSQPSEFATDKTGLKEWLKQNLTVQVDLVLCERQGLKKQAQI